MRPLLRRSTARWLRANLAAVTVAVAAVAAAGIAAPPAHADNAPIEVNYADPVTALPPVSRPPTKHCTVTAMQHDFANSYGQPFRATLSPPADCPGPWSKVVLDWSGSVAGRQYDRLAGVWIGGSEVFRTSTPEPDPDGISWHVDTDISRFIPLLRTPQPLVVDLGNIYNSTYTGIYHMTMTVTYYQADPAHPEAAHADTVVPLSSSTTDPGWWILGKGQTASTAVTVPRNTTRALMEVYARGGGCDEQWFTAVPDDLAAAHPDTLCGGGPYREVQVLLDGTPAGLAQPFPVIYTGGISPLMWRPIPAIDAFRTQPYAVDLTPFVGRLVDGQPHTVTFVPYGNNDNWTVGGTLFVDVDHARAQTSGALLSDTLTTAPQVQTSSVPADAGATKVSTSVTRDWATRGYVDTSDGRITTTVSQRVEYSNIDTVSADGTKQDVVERDSGTTTVTRTPQHGPAAGTRSNWSYPIDVTSDYRPGTAPNTFFVGGHVTEARRLDDQVLRGLYWQPAGFTDDELTADGVFARTNGVVTQADGSGSEHYTGTTDSGCYDHVIAADHGYVTRDMLGHCIGAWRGSDVPGAARSPL
jgi:Peptide N-acetyl-beta-D-glucosaminyl asparaginase amidase A